MSIINTFSVQTSMYCNIYLMIICFSVYLLSIFYLSLLWYIFSIFLYFHAYIYHTITSHNNNHNTNNLKYFCFNYTFPGESHTTPSGNLNLVILSYASIVAKTVLPLPDEPQTAAIPLSLAPRSINNIPRISSLREI